MKRRDVLKGVGMVAASSALGTRAISAESATQLKQQRPKRPNILVFLTDDQGQWLQEAYGNSEVRTPNMSRIARNGVLMRNAFTTSPVCSPARASFFTGRMPLQHGIYDWLEEIVHPYEALAKFPAAEGEAVFFGARDAKRPLYLGQAMPFCPETGFSATPRLRRSVALAG